MSCESSDAMADWYQEIPTLLHDAQFTGLQWEPHLRRIQLDFDCLRRNEDGSSLDDPVVELHLDSVEQLVAYYAPADLEVRPSEFVVRSRLSAADLVDWSQPAGEASLT